MNQITDLSNTTQQIHWMPGVVHNTQYVSINPKQFRYIRDIYRLFLDHVKQNQYQDAQGRGMYELIYNTPQTHLPKPSRLKQRYNTWASFLLGLEKNFATGTRHFTERQLPGIQEAVNMAVVYFTDLYPDVESEHSAYQIEFV